ncbi:MAG: hypothetical protein B6U75_03475 [Desulfurococcales archaeon ex4484_217_1]|nr:MAG: hypothetical protein B6U75_03475 [Desulfurococcales archaeon ex4484_217_1]
MPPESRVSAIVEYEIRDKEGKLIKKGKVKGRTWTKNFARLIRILFGETGDASPNQPVERGGVYVSVSTSDLGTATVKAPEGSDFYGIVVGKGGTPPTKEDSTDVYRLADQFYHGDADNKLHFYDTLVENVSVSDSNILVTVKRDFKNNGSVDVSIGEIGLGIKLTIGGSDYYFFIYVSQFTSAVSVPAGATITWFIRLKHGYLASETPS